MAKPTLEDTDVLFLNQDLGKNLTGIEHSALARAALFIDELGLDPLIVTFQYRPELQRNVRQLLAADRYHRNTRVIGLFDFLQGFDHPALKPSEQQSALPPVIDPVFRDFTAVPVKGFDDIRYLNEQGALFAYKVYSKEHGELTHINYFEKGKKVAADIYHATGHRSSHRLIDPQSQQRTHEIYYSPWGTPLFFRVFERPEPDTSTPGGLAPGFYLHVALTAQYPLSQPGPPAIEASLAAGTGMKAIDHIVHQCTFLGDSTDFSLYALSALTTRLARNKLWLLSDKNKFTFKPAVLLRDTPAGANRDKNIRVISAIHSTHYHGEQPGGAIKSHYRDLLQSQYAADGVVTLTQAQQRDIERRFPEQNVRVVPHTLSASYPASSSTGHETGSKAGANIVYVARLSPEKQHLMALEIFADVLRKAPAARLHIHGEGSERSKIEARIKALGLEDNVTLEGYCADLSRIYRDAHCAILTSKMEGFSLSLLEAMAFGCPVVAFDVNYGPGDLITSGETGFLAPYGDQQAFAQHLASLITTPKLAEHLGQNARHKFMTHFSPATVARLWAQTINERFR